MSINTVSIPDGVADARFKVVSQMALRGFDVDQVCLEVYRLGDEVRLRVTYAGCISGNLVYIGGSWVYLRWLHMETRHPVVNLDHAVLCLVEDLRVTCCKCRLPLLRVGNTL